MQKGTEKDQEKKMLLPTCQRTPAFFSGQRAFTLSREFGELYK
jgi:hypothetical protein